MLTNKYTRIQIWPSILVLMILDSCNITDKYCLIPSTSLAYIKLAKCCRSWFLKFSKITKKAHSLVMLLVMISIHAHIFQSYLSRFRDFCIYIGAWHLFVALKASEKSSIFFFRNNIPVMQHNAQTFLWTVFQENYWQSCFGSFGRCVKESVKSTLCVL